MKAIKSDSDSDSDEQKRSPGFSGKNRWVTPSVAAPGATHPSDATGISFAAELFFVLPDRTAAAHQIMYISTGSA